MREFDWKNHTFYAGIKDAIRAGADEVWSVEIFESERGWGSKVEDVFYFTSKSAADLFVLEYNQDNDKDVVPDYYIMARQPIKERI